MNTYYRLIEHLKAIFEQDVTLNTIVTGDANDVDEYKKNVFPLVHINVISAPFLGLQNLAVDRYLVELTCFDIRDINKEEDRNKFWTNDNRHDNFNLTHAILKKAQDKMIKQVIDDDISLETASAMQPLLYKRQNLLDGWQVTWTIDVPDTLTTVCDE